MPRTLSGRVSQSGADLLCGSRIYIERPIYEKFRDGFVEKVQDEGRRSSSEDTRMGALVSKAHPKR